jgi:hypothetical protein
MQWRAHIHIKFIVCLCNAINEGIHKYKERRKKKEKKWKENKVWIKSNKWWILWQVACSMADISSISLCLPYVMSFLSDM